MPDKGFSPQKSVRLRIALTLHVLDWSLPSNNFELQTCDQDLALYFYIASRKYAKLGFSSRAKLFQIVQFGIALTRPAFHLTQFCKFPQITTVTQRTHTDLTQFDITPFVHLSTSFGTHGSAKDKKFNKCSSIHGSAKDRKVLQMI